MRRFPAHLALTVVFLAILGALLHPLSLALGVAPFRTQGIVSLLRDVRTAIADLLGWGVLGLLVAMFVYVLRERLFNRTHGTALASYFPAPRLAHPSHSAAPRVVVAITAFNDAEATEQAVRDYRRQQGVVGVLVIDNNSTDGTAGLAEAAGATVIHENRQGYGYACIRGLTEGLKVPEADFVALTEGDGTFVADDMAKFLAYLDHMDLVVGNRMVRGLVEPDSQMDHFFTWGNMAVAILVRLRGWDGRHLGPAGLTDVGCTFRVIRRDALERILPDLTVGGNHFSPHMILVALAHGLSMVEIPIRFRRRIGDSKGGSRNFWSGLQVGIAMIWHIVFFEPGKPHERPTVVVERDGVIIRHRYNAGEQLMHVEFVPGATASLAALSRRGHNVIVIGDRSHHERAGISRKMARAIDARIAADVEHQGGRINFFLVCSHSGESACSCRQPQPRLLLKAARVSPLDLAEAVVVSDRPRFLTAAASLGCKTILIGNGDDPTSESPHDGHAPDLEGAVKMLLNARLESMRQPSSTPTVRSIPSE